MYIKSLTLNNFRNYDVESFEFSEGLNFLTGANAQGKTNAAEAIFFLCTGYSPRANRDKLVIKNGEEEIPTGRKKVGAILGDFVEVGCNSVLNPGTVIGRNSSVYPVSSVRVVIPENSIYKAKNDIVTKK